MKIYFIASSRLVNIEPKLYQSIYSKLAVGNKMLSDKVLKWTKKGLKDLKTEPLTAKISNYKESVECVRKADLVVMEVSGHSMSIGYLISKALEISKPVIALYKKDHAPNFIKGIVDPKLIITEYENESVLRTIEEAINKAKSLVDVRFNFFVNPKILTYLDWISNQKMLPRSVFLRNLIEHEMKKDKEFKA
ncbi:MAG: hypothetical protein WCG91_03380 [Candidatus Shapirobacteria bacterium]